MKKLIIAVASVTMAFALNAASYTWGNASGSYVGPNGENIDDFQYAGATAFLYLGIVTATDTAFDTSAATLVTSSGFNADQGIYGNLDSESLSESAVISNVGSGQDFTIIIVDGNVSDLAGFEGKYFLETGVSDDPGVLPGVTPVYYGQFLTYGEVGQADWATMANVPEPTSGLLLLLGMAGLALKRKNA